MEDFKQIEYWYKENNEPPKKLMILKRDGPHYSVWLLNSVNIEELENSNAFSFLGTQIFQFETLEAAEDYVKNYAEVHGLALVDKRIIG